jgi:peptide-methionine (R)-S-oxide reductase
MTIQSKRAHSGYTRRNFLALSSVAAGAALFMGFRFAGSAEQSETAGLAFEVHHTDAEWRTLLTSDQFYVLRQQGTERAFTSPLDHEKRSGVFACAGCKLDLFSSKTKYDSQTGWPSFWQPLPNAVGKRIDSTLGMERDEVHCRRCGGHLGHVFDDGPRPTGLRYCMNGVAMTFAPDASEKS